jgi:isopenicillin-N epimerase
MKMNHGKIIAAKSLNRPACNPNLWRLDRKIVFLNHGSFGACPRAVMLARQKFQARLERQPLQFFLRDLEPLLDEAREELARFVNAPADDLAFIPNATTGVNTVLRSLQFKRGDELLVTNHEYNASRNALNFVAKQSGATVIVAKIPFPLKSDAEIINAIWDCVTPRTRLALIDHVTSQTGLILPLERIVRELSRQGIPTLVDGAHAPGMIPLDLKKLGAAFYTGNCHKWLCAPKSAAFLYVERARQKTIRPLVISHGANSMRRDRSRFQLEFGWVGTSDPTAYLSVPKAIKYIGSLLPGGWTEVRRRNHLLAVAARKMICDALEIEPPCPEEMIGSMAAIPLAPAVRSVRKPRLFLDPLQDKLRAHDIEAPIIPWPAWPERCLRISAQLYNSLPQYEKLAVVLKKILAAKSA